MNTRDLFLQSKKFTTKWEKYFDVYDNIFERFKKKKITFVEVGVLNGESLQMWKKFFHPESRIIGIDYNPECKQFEKAGVEIYIGNQSDEKFWENFFKKIGKIDILLDDGGHTNTQQIITSIKSLPNIKDDGILMIEDTHASYMKEFGNPNKYSFINFTKKIIDDINYKYPNLGNFKFSLNHYIYSIQYFESIVIFHINTKKTITNKKIKNKLIENESVVDFRYYNSIITKLLKNKLVYKLRYLKKYTFIRLFFNFFSKSIIYLKNILDSNRNKKFFK